MKRPRVNEIFFQPTLARDILFLKHIPVRTQTRFPNQWRLQRVELPPAVTTSAVRDACSSAPSMKCFKRSNVKTSPTATPSFAKAKLLKVFLMRVRMLEERLVASLGDLRGVRARDG